VERQRVIPRKFRHWVALRTMVGVRDEVDDCGIFEGLGMVSFGSTPSDVASRSDAQRRFRGTRDNGLRHDGMKSCNNFINCEDEKIGKPKNTLSGYVVLRGGGHILCWAPEGFRCYPVFEVDQQVLGFLFSTFSGVTIPVFGLSLGSHPIPSFKYHTGISLYLCILPTQYLLVPKFAF